jgi:hypothetical protein
MYSDATKKYPNSATGFTADPWLYLYRWSRLFPTGVLENGEEVRDPYFDTKMLIQLSTGRNIPI